MSTVRQTIKLDRTTAGRVTFYFVMLCQLTGLKSMNTVRVYYMYMIHNVHVVNTYIRTACMYIHYVIVYSVESFTSTNMVPSIYLAFWADCTVIVLFNVIGSRFAHC